MSNAPTPLNYQGIVMKHTLFAVAFALATNSAFATPITNGDFSTGDVSGWQADGSVSVKTDASGRYAELTGNKGPNDYTTLAQTLHLRAGDIFSGQARFVTGDYLPYNDDAFVSINGLNLFVSNVSSVGSYGSSALTSFTWTATTAGDYVLNMGVTNRIDGSNPSFLQVRNFAVTSDVPEPVSIALLGLGLLGITASRRTAGKNKKV
jgi:hypothetical protein